MPANAIPAIVASISTPGLRGVTKSRWAVVASDTSMASVALAVSRRIPRREDASSLPGGTPDFPPGVFRPRAGRHSVMAMSIIEVRELSKRFGEVIAVDHLSFTVESGSVVGFLGPNGAGKTTSLRMLLGLIKPTGGSATINGQPYRELRAPLHVVGAALEASGAYPGRTARNHLRVQAMVGDVPRSRVDEILSSSTSPTRPIAESASSRWACASGSASGPRCCASRKS